MKIRVIVAGSRTFNNYMLLSEKLSDELRNFNKDDVEIISGGAHGADTFTEIYAKQNDYKITVMRADWKTYGKQAGFIRNNQMAEYAVSDNNIKSMLIAFWDGRSRGTRHTIHAARQNGILVKIVEFH